ncbi:hypothetical protein HAPAU_27460 [Halalkalicoccus paucihalophilus]|uniref:Uncharacterized protein n=1 Tax=Halalkalicoccus paucihalophilus TaxID=1008153 RepID=A0A151ACD1_9EURY|nr:DUF6653 family protein [Halalkalicoccus paucihalophilus]KYH25162.1 hypothetical protein HAPAU_27460 [Halalkalicoccus paucihalophilus]
MAIRNPMSERAWRRHANPYSGATRMLAGAALLSALYRHAWKSLGAVIGFLVLNPVLFPEPEDTDNWLSEGVLGERAWITDGHPMFGTDYPEVLNTVNVPLYLYTLYAAYRRYPLRTLVGFLVTFALKMAFVDAMARYYRDRDDLR